MSAPTPATRATVNDLLSPAHAACRRPSAHPLRDSRFRPVALPRVRERANLQGPCYPVRRSLHAQRALGGTRQELAHELVVRVEEVLGGTRLDDATAPQHGDVLGDP